MQNTILMRIQDDIPNTHSFVYKEEFEKNQNIELINDDEDGDIELSEETIQNFIDYVHRRTISVTNENVCELNFLSQKYEVESLKNPTEEYISNHRSELALQFLCVHQNDSKTSTEFYEEVISSHLEEFIKDKRILNLKVPILSRILVRYSKRQNEKDEESNNNNDDDESKSSDDDDENSNNDDDENLFSSEILHFLLNCVDKYGREASVLFENIRFGKDVNEVMDVIMSKYSQIIDFQFIEKSNFKFFYENQKNSIEEEINLRKKSEQNCANIQEQLIETQEQMKSTTIQLKETENKLNKCEDINEKLTKQLVGKQSELDILQENCKKISLQLNGKQSELDVLQENCKQISLQLNGKQSELDVLQENYKKISKQLDGKQSELDVLQENCKQISKQLNGKQSELGVLQGNYKKISIQLNESQDKVEKYKKNNEILKQEKEEMINELTYKTNIDDYEILRHIKKEGMVNVFEVKDKKTGKIFALKSYRNSSAFRNWTDFYVTICISRLGLPGIVKIEKYRGQLSEYEKTMTKTISFKEINNSNTIDLSDNIVITEFMKNGSIEMITQEYLMSKGSNHDLLNPTIRSKIIFGVACTMKQLHKRNVIHRNLSNSNILLDDNLEPRIGSFSHSKFATNEKEKEFQVGTPCFMAPELIDSDGEGYSFLVDVYSYSMVIYMMFSVTYPFCGKSNISVQDRMQKILNGERPSRPAYITDHYWELVQRCWKQDPNERPTFEKITEILKDDKYALKEFGMKTDLDQLHEYQKRIDIDE